MEGEKKRYLLIVKIINPSVHSNISRNTFVVLNMFKHSFLGGGGGGGGGGERTNSGTM